MQEMSYQALSQAILAYLNTRQLTKEQFYLNECYNKTDNAHNVQSLHKPHLNLIYAPRWVPHVLVTFKSTICEENQDLNI
jgi:hypothetical protein